MIVKKSPIVCMQFFDVKQPTTATVHFVYGKSKALVLAHSGTGSSIATATDSILQSHKCLISMQPN